MGSVRNSGIAVGFALLVAGAGPDSDAPVVNPRNCPSRLASDFINGVGRHDLARALNLRDRLFGDVHVEKAQNVGKAAEEKLPIKYAERWLLTADAVRGGKKDFAYDPNGLVPEVLRARALGLVPADDPRPQAWVRTSEYDEATGRMTHIHEKRRPPCHERVERR